MLKENEIDINKPKIIVNDIYLIFMTYLYIYVCVICFWQVGATPANRGLGPSFFGIQVHGPFHVCIICL